MNKTFQNIAILILALISFKSAFSQSIAISELIDGEVYYAEYEAGTYAMLTSGNVRDDVDRWSWKAGKSIFKFYKTDLEDKNLRIGSSIEINQGNTNYGTYYEKYVGRYRNLRVIREASKEEKHWLEVCIGENKTLDKVEALKKLPTKNRGEVKSEAIHLSANDRLQPVFKGRKDGFGFSGVSFNYQFVNCGGEVQMGVNIYTKHEYKMNSQTYNRRLTVNGYALEGKLYPTFTTNADRVEILEVEADLYFGNARLGKVNLDNIVGNFAGCFGETFLVIEQLGLDPKKKEYLENLDKFELKRIRILRGDIKISEKQRQEIHKSLKYDTWGNALDPNDHKGTNNNSEKKYDAFGNLISENTTKSIPTELASKETPKHNAFGNTINDIPKSVNNANKKLSPTDKQQQQYDAFGNPIKGNSQKDINKKAGNLNTIQSEKVYFIAMAFNRNVDGCSIKTINYLGYVLYEGTNGDYLKAIDAVKKKYPNAEDYTASDFKPGQHIILTSWLLNERPFAKSLNSCKRTVYEINYDVSLEEAMQKLENRFGTTIISKEVLINKIF